MLILLLDVCLVALPVLALIALMRARGPRYHNISLSEIHPDLAAGEELLEEAIAENQRMNRQVTLRPRSGAFDP